MLKHGKQWNQLCKDRGGVKPAPVSKMETKPRDMLWFSLRFVHLITDKGDPNGRNIQTGLANRVCRACHMGRFLIFPIPACFELLVLLFDIACG
jgi:hypothetical protein